MIILFYWFAFRRHMSLDCIRNRNSYSGAYIDCFGLGIWWEIEFSELSIIGLHYPLLLENQYGFSLYDH